MCYLAFKKDWGALIFIFKQATKCSHGYFINIFQRSISVQCCWIVFNCREGMTGWSTAILLCCYRTGTNKNQILRMQQDTQYQPLYAASGWSLPDRSLGRMSSFPGKQCCESVKLFQRYRKMRPFLFLLFLAILSLYSYLIVIKSLLKNTLGEEVRDKFCPGLHSHGMGIRDIAWELGKIWN